MGFFQEACYEALRNHQTNKQKRTPEQRERDADNQRQLRKQLTEQRSTATLSRCATRIAPRPRKIDQHLRISGENMACRPSYLSYPWHPNKLLNPKPVNPEPNPQTPTPQANLQPLSPNDTRPKAFKQGVGRKNLS